MYENRGVPANDLEFYNHIHAVEDLIAFINNPDANNEPEDTTIGVEFNFRIYSRRWGHYDNYKLTRTENGWNIKGASAFNNNIADKTGQPAVFKALQHDIISYPYNVDELLEWVWIKASEGENKESIQKAISDLAEWISICEKATPRGLYEELL